MQVSLPTDSDGFLSQQCPSCGDEFKVRFGEGSSESIGHCPTCGHAGQDCWWTPMQVQYMQAVALRTAMGPELKRLERELKSRSGGLLKLSLESKLPNVPPPPTDIDRDDLDVVEFRCCGELAKVRRTDQHYCVICGKRVERHMSDAKRVFLSHKGIDKSLVNEFKLTLQALGYAPWIDEDAMPAGTALERGLLDGMKESCGVVFFITEAFKDEGYLATEVEYAIRQKREKGDRFAIIALQFVGETGAVGEIPELLKGYVWKKPRNHMEALREIVRALPVTATTIDWRPGIPDVIGTPTRKTRDPELSNEAKVILIEAVSGDGRVLHMRFLGGTAIQANGKNLISDNSPRGEAIWEGGLEELARRGFIKSLGYKGEVFEVTRAGYEFADGLKAAAATVTDSAN